MKHQPRGGEGILARGLLGVEENGHACHSPGALLDVIDLVGVTKFNPRTPPSKV